MQRSHHSSRVYFGLITLVMLGLIASGWGQRMSPAAASQPTTKYRKIIAAPGEIDPNLPGVNLWHDYGSFALYRLTDSAYDALSADADHIVDRTAEFNQITVGNLQFDTQNENLEIPAGLKLDGVEGKSLQLVQFVGPVKADWLDLLKSEGNELVHYVANNAYLVWAGPEQRSQLDSLAQETDILQYSFPYQPYFKLGNTVLDRVLNPVDPEEVLRVTVQMYRHADKEASEALIQGVTLEMNSPWIPVLAFQNTTITLYASDITQIARLPDVYWIGEWTNPQLFDEVQTQILAGNLNSVQSGPAGSGYLDWLNNLGFSQNPDDYPVVDITDDGIGDGTLDTSDPTLHELGTSSEPTRLAFIQTCNFFTINGGGEGGHGHINASIAGGYDERSGAPYRDANGFQRGLGVNPYGRLGGTRIFGLFGYDDSNCGGSETGLIAASYQAGARISSNSWGCGANTPSCVNTYDPKAQAYDIGVRDALLGAPGNQEFVIVFAAGNDGDYGAMSIGSPGNAKNVITVGASESYRPEWTDGCFVAPSGADNAMDVAYFSSRGPAPGLRVKPEVIAPGTHIQGTASTNPSYTGNSVCDMYMPSNGQTVFAASSGTSHSTPAVSGVASLYYYWLEHTYGLPKPSPALIKAYLIAHPTYLTGVSANDTLPSNNQGYGMPDMETAFDDTARYLLNQTTVLDNTGETWRLTGEIADPGKPVRIVMAYTDQAGAVGTSPQVNDLNLAVILGGVTYRGNHFSGAWSTSGGLEDSKNNVEVVYLPAGTSGSFEASVTAFNLPGDGVPNYGDDTDQDFALVCYNCAVESGYKAGIAPFSQSKSGLWSSEAVYTFTVSNLGQNSDTFSLSVESVWNTAQSVQSLALEAGESGQLSLTVTIPVTAADGEVETATLIVTSNGDPNQMAFATTETQAVWLRHYLPLVRQE